MSNILGSRSLCYLSVDSQLIQVNATMYIASLIHKQRMSIRKQMTKQSTKN
jgi:hypothetical protein